MKYIPSLAVLFLSVCSLTVNAEEAKKVENSSQTKVTNGNAISEKQLNAPTKTKEEKEKPKLLNPAEHDSSTGLHYGQQNYGRSAFAEADGNRTLGGRGVNAPVLGREAEQFEAQKREREMAEAQKPKPPEAINFNNAQGHIPVYERKSLFKSYLIGVVDNAVYVHINPSMLTSSLDLYSGEVFVDVAKKNQENVRAFAMIVRLQDGSQTSVFQADRGENFKVGQIVKAPIILNKDDFILGIFQKAE